MINDTAISNPAITAIRRMNIIVSVAGLVLGGVTLDEALSDAIFLRSSA
ncbi:hypothetical protein [Agrobacterium sp. NPDC090283]